MNRKCLYCYKELAHSNQRDYHDKCSLTFFGSKQAPLLTYSLNEMNELAKNVVESSITVPGVQLSISADFFPRYPEKSFKIFCAL